MKLLTLVAAVLVAGCAAGPRATLPGSTASVQTGANTIVGRTVAPVNCTGSPVHLIPATTATRERYGPMQGKLVEPSFDRAASGAPRQDIALTTTCDASGTFRFERVPDGEFFVQTFLAWSEAGSIRGGTMVGSASVRGGQTQQITLTR